MTESTYTPGPWHSAKTSGDQGLIISEDGKNVAVSYDKKDAALIASAPSMLEALKKLCDSIDDDDDALHHGAIGWKYVREARAVIQEAEGQS